MSHQFKAPSCLCSIDFCSGVSLQGGQRSSRLQQRPPADSLLELYPLTLHCNHNHTGKKMTTWRILQTANMNTKMIQVCCWRTVLFHIAKEEWRRKEQKVSNEGRKTWNFTEQTPRLPAGDFTEKVRLPRNNALLRSNTWWGHTVIQTHTYRPVECNQLRRAQAERFCPGSVLSDWKEKIKVEITATEPKCISLKPPGTYPIKQ